MVGVQRNLVFDLVWQLQQRRVGFQSRHERSRPLPFFVCEALDESSQEEGHREGGPSHPSQLSSLFSLIETDDFPIPNQIFEIRQLVPRNR